MITALQIGNTSDFVFFELSKLITRAFFYLATSCILRFTRFCMVNNLHLWKLSL